MLKRLVLLIMFCFILTGCSVEYNLDINDSGISDELNINIKPEDKINQENDEELMGSRLVALIDYDVYPYFQNYSAKYNKELITKSGYEILNLKYNYDYSNYRNSNVINNCFHNRKVDIDKNYYSFDLSGYFYCLYNNEEIVINVKTDYDVIENNATRINDNVYTWVINKNNYTNVNLKFKATPNEDNVNIGDDGNVVIEEKEDNTFMYIILAVLGIGFLISIVIIYEKVKKSNK